MTLNAYVSLKNTEAERDAKLKQAKADYEAVVSAIQADYLNLDGLIADQRHLLLQTHLNSPKTEYPDGTVEVYPLTKYVLDDEMAAIGWALEHKHADLLSIKKAQLNKYMKIGEVYGAHIEEEPTLKITLKKE